jgi:hypothetical protein
MLGNDREIINYSTAVATQRLQKEACFHCNKKSGLELQMDA